MAIGQLIVFKHKRPRFPKDTPIAIKDLAERCWQPKATSRPSFETILEELQKLKASIDEQSEPWPAVPPSLQPAASGGFSEPFSSIGEDRESPIEPLDTAQFASR